LKTPRLTVWAPLPPNVYSNRRVRRLPFPLDEPAGRLYSRARHGLYRGVKALGLRPGDKILAPAYHHGSEIEALKRAGLDVHFYEIGTRLEPNEDQLDDLVDDRVRALYLIHYFGIPQDLTRWRAWCDERNLELIEDGAMAWLSTHAQRPVGSFGDLAIFCLYKTVGLPDGGALISRSPPPSPHGSGDWCLGQTAIRHTSWLAQRYGSVAAIHTALKNRTERTSRLSAPKELEFETGNTDAAPCKVTTRLLARVSDVAIAERRRIHYKFLLRELRGVVRPLLPDLPDGASPVGFPIVVEPPATPRLQDLLGRLGVVASTFWPTPHPSLPRSGFERSQQLRVNCLVLPAHHELREKDLHRIAEAVAAGSAGAAP
jgi:dTDP-4-amino-4,6-dideoxygalactose transaminase